METAPTTRHAYLPDVGDEEWAFVTPYLTLTGENAPQRHSLRELLNGPRFMARGGQQWRLVFGGRLRILPESFLTRDPYAWPS